MIKEDIIICYIQFFFIIEVKRGYHYHILISYSVTGKNSVVTKTLKLLFFNVEGHMF